VRRKYFFLAVVAGFSVAADQLTKWWAAARLRQGCYDPESPDPKPVGWVTHCDRDDLTVDLQGRSAREVTFYRGSNVLYRLTCLGAEACLSGEVRLGQEAPGARVERLARDPVQQAVLMLRQYPIQVETLTSGPDGQLYRVAVRDAEGRLWERRFLYRSPADPVRVIPNLFHLSYVENPGAAWGLFAEVDDSWRGLLFGAISLLAVVVVLWLYRRLQPDQVLQATGLALVLGGAIGNFLDRIRLGQVIDFISWHYYERFRWPTFNLADAAITVGVGLLLLDAVRTRLRERRAKKEATGVPT